MAQSGYTPIALYHSTTPGAEPTAGNLQAGEIALNIPDGKLFYNKSGVVTAIAGLSGYSGYSGYSGANVDTSLPYTWTGKQTFAGTSSTLAEVVTNIAEPTTISATAATGTVNFDLTTQSILYLSLIHI